MEKRKLVSAPIHLYRRIPIAYNTSVSLVGMKNSSVIYRMPQMTPDGDRINLATQKGANTYIRLLQKDGMPPFSSKLLAYINHYIHKPQNNIEEVRRQLQVDAGESILQSLYSTLRCIFIHASNDLLREVVTDTELRIIFNHFVSLMKCAISRKNKGIDIDEAGVHEAMLVMSNVLNLNPSHDIIQEFLKSLADTAKSAANVSPQDSGVGYCLCHTMIECFYYSITKHGTKKISIEKRFMMMHKTGMLEQVLRYIHLPWTQTTNNEMREKMRFVFITLASSTISLSNMFKAGSPSRDALVDILEGRIKPCPENKHMMEILEALKKFIDMGLTSGNPDGYIPERHVYCAKCKKGDPTRKLQVCARCKEIPCEYCS